MTETIIKFYNYFERVVVLTLLCMLMVVVVYAIGGFLLTIGYTMVERLQSNERHLTMPILHEVFAGFLMILIGLELMKTIVMYLDEHVIHVEVVMSVAMIAIARHAIDVDYKTAPPLAMVGIGIIIIALSVGYYFFKKADHLIPPAPLKAGTDSD
jgi:uncharacterized membrane protein (DUF373 family)